MSGERFDVRIDYFRLQHDVRRMIGVEIRWEYVSDA